ncbi:BMP family ABC transporter substrate-binding protein [Jeotgalibacillus soli]|uniref:Transcriptional regulator n=1 Tax=Jeotgalibacillus soli TaxID=889306 RepID=A0A0C2V9N7_9BACL|nr:BMP family ABC transporter substrate-binding protein [Jeotgalibacillus soli]KIL45672.1 transcriptional regulator [Jeotgalibacillus soli]
MTSEEGVRHIVEEYSKMGVSIIFGHGEEYVSPFNKIAVDYPDIHFVSFNGEATEENTTTLNFEGYARGFFAGMVAAHQSNSKQIGVIAAKEWQPEVKAIWMEHKSNILP